MSKGRMVIGGAIAFLGGTAGMYLIAHKPKPVGAFDENERRRVFNAKARCYDAHVDSSEGGWIDIKGLRVKLVEQAHGEVLEIAAGTGRNLQYYRAAAAASSGESSPPSPGAQPGTVATTGGVTHLILADFAPEMLEVAREHASTLSPPPPPTTYLTTDAHALPIPTASMDCVVDTFGLCSLGDPVQALREVARVVKPGGKVLLLEHGRSSWGSVNWFLDKYAPSHRAEWGCEWNRDPVRLVREAGMQVLSCKRKHAGTTYVIVATTKGQGARQSTDDGPLR